MTPNPEGLLLTYIERRWVRWSLTHLIHIEPRCRIPYVIRSSPSPLEKRCDLRQGSSSDSKNLANPQLERRCRIDQDLHNASSLCSGSFRTLRKAQITGICRRQLYDSDQEDDESSNTQTYPSSCPSEEKNAKTAHRSCVTIAITNMLRRSIFL